MRIRVPGFVFLLVTAAAVAAQQPAPPPPPELVRGVRSKLSAGDLLSGQAMAEDYKREKGVDAEYLNAVGWIARGAEMLGRLDVADEALRELRREIPNEDAKLLTPYGAAIETEGRLILRRQGRGAAIRYFEQQLALAKATSLRSRISKNLDMIALEGQPAPAIAGKKLESGKPAVLFFFAEWCGDCKAQAASLTRVWEKYRSRVSMTAVTRLYSTPTDEKPMTPEEETAKVKKVWAELYPGLADVPVVIDTDAMVRYGVSATPTFALVDRRGNVRMYTATRLSEAELSRQLDTLLAENP